MATNVPGLGIAQLGGAAVSAALMEADIKRASAEDDPAVRAWLREVVCTYRPTADVVPW